MASVKALRDGEEQGLECLGELRAVKGALAKELLIQKPVTIPGAGSYLKDFTAPLYGRGVMAELAKAGLLDTGLLTCTGKTVAENLAGVVNRDPEIIRPIDNHFPEVMNAHQLCQNTGIIQAPQFLWGDHRNVPGPIPASGSLFTPFGQIR